MFRDPCEEFHSHESDENENKNRGKTKKDKCRIDFVRSSCRLSGTDELDIFDFCSFIIIFLFRHQNISSRPGIVGRRLLPPVRSYVLKSHLFIYLFVSVLRCAFTLSFLVRIMHHPGDRTRRKFHRYRHETIAGEWNKKKSTLRFNRCASMATYWLTTVIRYFKSS